MRRIFLAVMLFAAACAKGAATEVDAKQASAADARIGADAPTFPGTPDAPPGTPDAPLVVPDARVVDATPPDAMPPDAMVVLPDGGPLGTGDTCATANDISAQAASAAGFTFNGNTTGLVDDIQPTSSCTSYVNDGPDAVFIVTAAAGQTITASITTTWDAAVEIIPTCIAAPTCLAGTDDLAGGGTETAVATVATAGTYYVVADSWDAGAYGPYTLTVKVQ